MTPEMYQTAEQAHRETQQDQQAEEWGFATVELADLVKRWGKATVIREVMSQPDTAPPQSSFAFQPTCEQCVNWRPRRTAVLGNGSTTQVGGFCEARAAADLAQMPTGYAERCQLFEEKIPF